MQTLFDALEQAAARYSDHAFLCIPPRADRPYLPEGLEITFAQMHRDARALAACYKAAGWGPGHRIALALDNHPGHILHFLALNALGVSQVPVNPYYLSHELDYLLDHSGVDMAVVLPWNSDKLRDVRPDLPQAEWRDTSDPAGFAPPDAPAMTPGPAPTLHSEIALIYTSGTTARPKGAIIDNAYAFAVGRCYAGHGGALALREGVERIYLPLPFFHVNAGVNTITTALLTGICLIVPDRFHASSWWDDLAQTRATAFHYLGIIPPVLMAAAPTDQDIKPDLRFGLGAGIDPALHAAFEARFGVPMVEVWGMTETGRFLAACHAPRLVHTRAFGRTMEGHLEARVVDETGAPVPDGTQGELVVRAPGDDPRAGFFQGYLKNTEATEEAWRSGWFHTGDVVTRDETGMLHFCERSKNMIRRSGENISAAEVEDALIDHVAVDQVAVLAVPDAMRDEEVMACIVLAKGIAPDAATAQQIVEFCSTRVAYYKSPAWIQFRADLPVTGTQKIQKHRLFETGQDPRSADAVFDLRELKSSQRKISA
jgi:acyl-CoA synthetase (AMP-forming)/AMP-acid ligase II